MLKRLHLKNFTVFADADFEFVQGLNVLVGTNGTGKSHVLKLGYAVESVGAAIKNDLKREEERDAANKSDNDYVSKPRDAVSGAFAWHFKFRNSLPALFLVHPSSLIKWDAAGKSEVAFVFDERAGEKIVFSITPNGVSLNELSIRPSEEFNGIFVPAKEILTLSWMMPASAQLVAPIEQNYLDLLNQLRLLPLRKPEAAAAIEALTEIIGGEIREEGDKYYLVDKTGRRTAVSMVAEGLRKFGTLQKLLANGSLTKQATLFWDEPEANLNPALLRQLAAILAELARQGFQIILATHSMSLLKEFHILSRETEKGELPIKYFSLSAAPGEATTVVAKTDFKYLPNVVALDVELDQADDLEEIFARESRQAHADNN